jgi:hypothetical protein
MRSTSEVAGPGTVPSPGQRPDAVDPVTAADVNALTDAGVLDHLRALNEKRCALDAAFTQAVAVAHSRGAGEVDGCVSTKSWLRSQLRMSYGGTNAYVEVAGALADLPRFAALFADGRINLEHIQALAELHKKAGPEVAGIADAVLGDYALEHGPREIRRLAKLIREHYERLRDADSPDDPDGRDLEPDRFVSLGQTFGGTWSLDGALAPEIGSMLRAALDAAMRRPAPDDDRSTAQRRHDAFADLIRLAVNSGELPTKGGERPHLGALVHLDDLRAPENRRQPSGSGVLPDELGAYLAAVDADLTARSTHLGPEDLRATEAEPAALDPSDAAAEPVTTPEATPDDDAATSSPYAEGTTDTDGEPSLDWLPPAWLPDLGAHTDPPDEPGLPDGLQSVLPGLGINRRHLPRPGQGALTDHGTHLTPQAAQRLACDSQLHRVVLGPRDLPLNLGQRVRLVPAPMRRVIVARDRHCRFPGCDMPAAYTEVHHLKPWQDGGPTEPQNLILQCGWHHHRVHDHGWTLRYNHRTNTVTALRPDGSELTLPRAG